MLKQVWPAASMFVVLSAPLLARAGVVPAGTEFQVNTYTSSFQQVTGACAAPDGSFVVVWNSGPRFRGIFGQRYTSSGAKAGTEFQVNTYTPYEQGLGGVCCDAAGDFVVVWQNNHQDGDREGIFGQRFASSGASLGTEFLVNTYTTTAQFLPQVCCDAAGDFVVVWTSLAGNYTPGSDVFGQRFLSDGSFSGGPFQVNTYTPSYQSYSALCCDAAGDFAVVWESNGQDGQGPGVFGQRFASDGLQRGTEFQVNTYTNGYQKVPAICCDREGDFTVVWDAFPQGLSPGDVFGQRYASSGASRGTEFQVNVYTTGNQAEAGGGAICCAPNGDFVVTWTSEDQDGFRDGVFARRFSHLGGASSEFQVNTYTSNFQSSSRVACDASGGFVIVWNSEGQDGDSTGVFGQRFALLAQVPTPALSFAGIAASVVALLGAGAAAFRRRRRRG